MSTSGVSGNLSQLDTLLNSAQQFLTDFKQLGTDLQSGNTRPPSRILSPSRRTP